MNEIDPIQYGKLTADVENLQKQVSDLSADVKTLLELANRSRGALWAGMGLASLIGAAVTHLADLWHIFK